MFPDDDAYLGIGMLCDPKIKRIFTKHLTFSTIELPKFNKSLDKCKNKIDYWTYIIKNSYQMTEEDKQEILHNTSTSEIGDFIMAMHRSKVSPIQQARLDNAAMVRYSMEEAEREKIQNAMIDGMNVGRIEGIEVGREKERSNIISAMKKFGLSKEDIDQIMSGDDADE